MATYKTGEPLEVAECLVQIYQDDNRRWWRYCLTCDNGSNKHGKHIRGHKTEADAKMSKRDHENQMRKNRIAKVYYDRWRLAVVLAKTWDEFQELWWVRFAERGVAWQATEETPERLEIMYDIQRRYVDNIGKEAKAREVRIDAHTGRASEATRTA